MRHLCFALTLTLFSAGAAAQEASTGTCNPDLINFRRPTTLQVTMSEYLFSPEHIELKACLPYRLILINQGHVKHDFSAPRFFASVLIKKYDGSVGAVTTADLRTLDLPAHASLEWYILPTQPGRYQVECTHFTHAARGMTGTIDVYP
jgi:uncharacterized cupredoxin-like copper-binding protein